LGVRAILDYQTGSAVVRKSGLNESWSFSLREDTLRVKRPQESGEALYQRLKETPPELRLDPFPIGKPVPLNSDRVQAIQAELALRMAVDQEVQKSHPRSQEAAAVNAENALYLRGLVKEFGWIDVGRFGVRASCQAAILAQHHRDLPLMLAALPLVERDLKGNPDGTQVYAVFFDALQMELGEGQRYGTQVGMDDAGNPLVLSLENRAELDRWRKEIGLPPMADYLKLAGQYLYPGKEIRFADDLPPVPPLSKRVETRGESSRNPSPPL